MKKAFKIFLLLGVLVSAKNLSAQNMSDMRLNEVVAYNTDGYIDDYGCRSSWIEVFNTSYGTVDIGGCYLTDDRNNLTKYMIPKGDVLTKIKPRQHALFYADNLPDRGTFHINFDIPNASEIIFVSSDGRTIIDEVKLPSSGIPENKSYGRIVDGQGSSEPTHFLKKSWNITKNEKAVGENGGWAILNKVTPSSNNYGSDQLSSSSILEKTDPYGFVMAITAMSVVFLALILLYFVFKKVGNNAIRKSQLKEIQAKGGDIQAVVIDEKEGSTSAEVFAAIAMAMHLYKKDGEAHDIENTILTIHKESKTYSPWSSKIYTLRDTPQLKKK